MLGRKTRMKPSMVDQIFDITVYILLTLALLAVLYPLYFMIIASFSNPNALYQGRVILLPKDVTVLGYQRIFSNNLIFRSYMNSILYTIAGVLVCVTLTIPTAFALSRP